jgi:membrane protein YqaA with SNARE-associated domain
LAFWCCVCRILIFPNTTRRAPCGNLGNKGAGRALFYATVTTAGSVLGGLAGVCYWIFLFQTVGTWLVGTYHLEAQMLVVQRLFSENAFFAIFTAAFTPIPYKLFTISAGLFAINIPVFIIASILGRGMRFFAVALVMKYLSQHVSRVFYKYFNTASLVVVAVLGILLYIFMKG